MNSTPRVVKSDEEWREQLSAIEYEVTRKKGTERAFTGRYWNCTTPGTYHCIGCGAELFAATEKFESGCGWPSFTAPMSETAVAEHEDLSHGMRRIEVTCTACASHLGHVFPDGPGPDGLRYCINSASLRLNPTEPENRQP